jgi:hypothetical protein
MSVVFAGTDFKRAAKRCTMRGGPYVSAGLVAMHCGGEFARQGQRRVGLSWHSHAVATVFENLEVGASIEDIMEWFDLTREQVTAVLDFAARSLTSPIRS